MKILSCAQQKEADAYTISNENILSINLMEKAASAITDEICKRWNSSHRIVTFAGAGNNGGDAIAVSRMLYLKGYKVKVYFFKALRLKNALPTSVVCSNADSKIIMK